ncbi:hypothetical protein Glove_561g28 [Diversispora epigaea]|uniref:Uncharacterized protein n=1 Tax=Diversispora epigaea TaxID=1348612 RepID=A0A397GGD4_9GLOM|nr:hypothetical protein Glove_561g28 [Diversispora epigaea]
MTFTELKNRGEHAVKKFIWKKEENGNCNIRKCRGKVEVIGQVWEASDLKIKIVGTATKTCHCCHTENHLVFECPVATRQKEINERKTNDFEKYGHMYKINRPRLYKNLKDQVDLGTGYSDAIKRNVNKVKENNKGDNNQENILKNILETLQNIKQDIVEIKQHTKNMEERIQALEEYAGKDIFEEAMEEDEVSDDKKFIWKKEENGNCNIRKCRGKVEVIGQVWEASDLKIKIVGTATKTCHCCHTENHLVFECPVATRQKEINERKTNDFEKYGHMYKINRPRLYKNLKDQVDLGTGYSDAIKRNVNKVKENNKGDNNQENILKNILETLQNIKQDIVEIKQHTKNMEERIQALEEYAGKDIFEEAMEEDEVSDDKVKVVINIFIEETGTKEKQVTQMEQIGNTVKILAELIPELKQSNADMYNLPKQQEIVPIEMNKHTVFMIFDFLNRQNINLGIFSKY